MPPAGCWFLVFVWVWAWCLQLVLVAPAQAQTQGEGCSAKTRCANLTISDPFWIVDKESGRSCGGSDFEVFCNNSIPSIRSSGLYGFQILGIAYEERSLRVVDLSKLRYLKDSGRCSVPSWNTSGMLGPSFTIDPRNLDLVMYNCTTTAAARRDPATPVVPMRCGNGSGAFARVGGYYDDGSANYEEGYSIQGCEATIVPVMAAAGGEADASEYEQLIRGGFLLTWKDPPPRRGRWWPVVAAW